MIATELASLTKFYADQVDTLKFTKFIPVNIPAFI